MAEFDEKALEEYVESKINPPQRKPANRRQIVEKLLNVSRRVGAERERGIKSA